ncbi:hypothetical protein [Neisseria elongata]|uniref:hypothetical protein n=1 Tax=Neisseria elongata TaxID=495 RepID=UPI0006680F12|nr:hypothetical protein [Neisseria elongata]
MPGVDALGWFKGEQFKSAKCFQYSPKLIGLFADHMELRAVCHTDKRYSTGEALNIVDDEDAVVNDGGADEAQGDEAQGDEVRPYPGRIAQSELVRMVRERLERRRDKWQAFWPFDLAVGDKGYCTLSFVAEHPHAPLYLYFLMALYGKYLHHPNAYRNYFETVCLALMQRIYPANSGWTVRQTGAAIGGDAHANLSALATDLSLTPASLRRQVSSSGDGGIDLAAFHKSSSDDLGCLPFVAMQCACSSDIDELEKKANEGSYHHLNNIFSLDIVHSHILLSPYDWFDIEQPNRFVAKNTGAVVFDRARILQNIVDLNVSVGLPDDIADELSAFMQADEQFE